MDIQKAGRKKKVWRLAYEQKPKEYLTEFKGTLSECIKEEKRKIYYYAILPENLKRNNPLIRPPGNKIDF
jgi:hypothetical protein